MRRHVMRRPECRALLLVTFATLIVAPGCHHAVRGQPLATHLLPTQVADFTPPDPDDVVLHYYGVGGWGILWRDEYLLTAPYFSNHDLAESSICEAYPNQTAIDKGFANTPYDRTKVILVGHGHIDHAADIPAYPFAGKPGASSSMPDDPTLIADQSTLNLLGDDVRKRVCAIALPASGGSSAISTAGEKCSTGSFRITPLPWAHAPHLGMRSLGIYSVFGSPQGTQRNPLTKPPATGNEWLVGRTWAFLIELMDGGSPVFRILYVDSAASPDYVAPWPTLDDAPIDVHIACMPNFDLVDGYPTDLLTRYHVKHVLAGHWENFFKPRDAKLAPVMVLSDRKMTAFVRQVETAIGDSGKGPTNKQGCKVGENCGPHDDAETWTVPIPGETFWFDTGDHAAAPGS
jgi:hypothetical protein